jgi:group I intron endonuclease
MGIIYKLISPSGKIYIGKANDFDTRMKGHLYCANKGRKNALYESIRMHGFDSFKKIIIDCEDIQSVLNDKEKFWISHYKSNERKFGYNMTVGGDGGDTRKGLSNDKLNEIKQKAKQRCAERNPNRSHLIEVKQKISKSILKHLETLSESEKQRRFNMTKRGLIEYYKSEKGKLHALSTQERMKGEKNPQYGLKGELSPNWKRQQSEYCKRKAFETHKGKLVSETTKRKQQLRCEERNLLMNIKNNISNEIFETKNLLKFCDEHNLNYNVMYNKLKGATSRTLKEWEFIEV